MSQENYIRSLLNIKDQNSCEKVVKNVKIYKFINAYLSYILTLCEKYSIAFNSKEDYKRNKKDYRKLKRYWKLLLKSRSELKASVRKKYICFNDLTTEIDIVNYLINLDKVYFYQKKRSIILCFNQVFCHLDFLRSQLFNKEPIFPVSYDFSRK